MDRAIVRLIAITDNVRDGQSGLIARAVAAAEGGATSIQLRLKDVAAHDLVLIARDLVKAVAIPVIVNDRADVAIAAGAAGVHLGPDDVPVKVVRAFAPAGFIIGTSVGLTEEIRNAEGADYVRNWSRIQDRFEGRCGSGNRRCRIRTVGCRNWIACRRYRRNLCRQRSLGH